jgi:hypothetical protein
LTFGGVAEKSIMRGLDTFEELTVLDEACVPVAGAGVPVGIEVTAADETAVSVTTGGVSFSGRAVPVAGTDVVVIVGVGWKAGVSDTVWVGVVTISSAFAENTFNGALNKIAAARKRRAITSVLGLTANMLPPTCNYERFLIVLLIGLLVICRENSPAKIIVDCDGMTNQLLRYYLGENIKTI